MFDRTLRLSNTQNLFDGILDVLKWKCYHKRRGRKQTVLPAATISMPIVFGVEIVYIQGIILDEFERALP